MCAIFGVLGEYNTKTAHHALKSMAHRGPDYCGVVEERNVFFAHQRLSILDLHERAHQPLRHQNVLLSFNGEIYNFKALKKELDFEFKGESDTEVLLAAYMKWGIDFISRLTGMFAIAIKDGETLYLIRDRLGKKPLFYLHQKACFAFASEIKGLKPFLKQTKMNNDAMLSYLSFLAPTPPHTFYEGIEKLEAGMYLCYKDGKVEKKRYFSLLDGDRDAVSSEEEAIKGVHERLEKSLHLRLACDVPIASLLSGGIDSALMVAMATKQGQNLKTFTLGYEGFSNYDESDNALQTSLELGVSNQNIQINEQMFMRASEAVFESLDEPLNDPAAVPLYLLFEGIKKEGYKVVLSGEGSDELFLGYRQYFEYLDIEKAKGLLHKNWLKKYFRANFSMNREWEWYKRIFNDEVLFRTSGDKFTDLQKNQLLRQNVRDGASMAYLQPYRDDFESSSFKDESFWYSYVDLKQFQAEHFLTKLDRVSMAHAIESRTPYLDHNLVQYVFSLAPELRYQKGVTKALLKSVATPYLSSHILNRKKKGFSNPYMEYLIASGAISLIQEVNKKTKMFHEDVLARYIQTAKKGTFKQHIWGLYVLSYWIKKNLL
ncbi:MAG TPA: asparagine synthase (glutamine-hydrolyzing) [Helicobacteraceae bacterium]|nr:asparagine synthase (glutamine-hydrolyzing) [Helicobacteraceae bacterium]